MLKSSMPDFPTLQLFYAPTSPYVRKVMVAAHLLGLRDRIVMLPSAAHPVQRDASIAVHNPLAKVPTAICEDGSVLFDSRVICEYLDAATPGTLFPPQGEARWRALTRQAIGDGLLDAALLARYETSARPPSFQWPVWREAQLAKVEACLADIDSCADALSKAAPAIGEIAIGCALGYLDFRFPELAWRDRFPAAASWFADFNATPAMASTIPFDQP